MVDFDLTCNYRLRLFDVEAEARAIEAASMGALAGLMGGTVPSGTSTEPYERW
jgi:hypothetical protein